MMGFADLLFKLGVAYDSDEALALADRIGVVHPQSGWDASERLAEYAGQFPGLEGQRLGNRSTAAGRCGTPTS